MYIFTDCSIIIDKNIGVGSYLFLDKLEFHNENKIKKLIKNIQYETRSSTEVEMFTIAYCFNYLHKLFPDPSLAPKIHLYTDCKSFINLITERKNKIKPKHRYYDLYMYLIETVEAFDINAMWTKGHVKKESRKEIHQKIFAVVDQNAREISRYLAQNKL